MAKQGKPPKELLERIGGAFRRIAEQGALTREMIAGHFALPRTDRAGLDFLYSRGGACSAGELSKATGLTSGSTTALIDRLEKAGYVARERDPNDRRKQIVHVPARVFARCEAVYSPIRAEMFKLWSSYSVEDLKFLEEFLTRSTQVYAECVDCLITSASQAPEQDRRSFGAKRGRS
jgi:DNA-binding MarR family transcriptional regulator